jgi:purine-binding chemotaxis protein CheW
MSALKPEAVALAEQAEALTRYLEDLFAEKPAFLPVPVTAPARAAPVQRVIDLPVTRIVEEERVVVPPAPPVAAVPVIERTEAATRVEAARPATDDPRPDWAREPFPCLLLKVQGLSLALPLVKLNRILPWSEPTLIPGYVGWLLGMLRDDSRGRALKVVDTAGFIMPERPAPAGEAIPPQHIVLIGEGEWGLTCEDVSSVITLDPTKVRWRTHRTKRPWLAGTVVEHLCALLDAERLDEMLSSAAPGLPS